MFIYYTYCYANHLFIIDSTVIRYYKTARHCVCHCALIRRSAPSIPRLRRGANAVTVRPRVSTYAARIWMRAHAVAFYYMAKGPPKPSIIARSAQSNAPDDAHWIIFVSYQTASHSRIRGKIFKQIMADCVKQFRGSLLLKRTPIPIPPPSKRTCRQERAIFSTNILNIAGRNGERKHVKKETVRGVTTWNQIYICVIIRANNFNICGNHTTYLSINLLYGDTQDYVRYITCVCAWWYIKYNRKMLSK